MSRSDSIAWAGRAERRAHASCGSFSTRRFDTSPKERQFNEGAVEEFKRLSAQCMEIVRKQDTGTLQYEVYFNHDQSECVVLERYRDSDALIEHAVHLGDLGEAILRTGWVAGELLGEPSAEIRSKLVGSEIRLFTPFLSL